MDNHGSHIFLTVSLIGRKHGVVMLTIHPHTLHKLQPLVRTVYGPFKRYYNSAPDSSVSENAVARFSVYKIALLAKQAFEFAFTQGITCLAFKALESAYKT